MCALEERRDLVSVFMPPEYLSALERDAFLRTLDRRMQAVPNLRRDDVLAMLAPLADPDRSIEFHALSRAVRAHRAAIVRQFANPNYIVRQAAKEHRIRLARRCPVMTVADRTLPDDLPPYERLAKLLHRHAFQITPSRAASSSANVNVRILLDRPSDSTTGWDGNFGLAVRHD
ncbi:R3H domain-containing protein [Plasmodiophora brassicae]|nr:hypothetical protein PBRA_008210 [Plasmodiophora brassicae]